MEIESVLRENIGKITGEKREKFDRFESLLLEYNERYNLTAITEKKEIFYKHFLDSSVSESLFFEGANVVEVGSGAGFPSLVLKILREDLRFTLIESVGKKCEFLRAAVDNLGFTGVHILNIRAEDAGKDKRYREKFDFCVARAVARMNSLSEYCLPLVKVGGKLIAYKSGDEAELKEAERAYQLLGGRSEQPVFYELPEGYGKRSLAIVEKVKSTPARYPRGNGQERKRPL